MENYRTSHGSAVLRRFSVFHRFVHFKVIDNLRMHSQLTLSLTRLNHLFLPIAPIFIFSPQPMINYSRELKLAPIRQIVKKPCWLGSSSTVCFLFRHLVDALDFNLRTCRSHTHRAMHVRARSSTWLATQSISANWRLLHTEINQRFFPNEAHLIVNRQ